MWLWSSKLQTPGIGRLTTCLIHIDLVGSLEKPSIVTPYINIYKDWRITLLFFGTYERKKVHFRDEMLILLL